MDDTIRPTGMLKLVPQAAASVGESNAAHVIEAREMMQRAVDGFRGAGLQASGELEKGDAQRLLCDEARKWQADFIFVGARGFTSALERFRAGSVSTALATTAPCSVEIVRGLGAPGNAQTA